MHESWFICTDCGIRVRTYRFVNYRTIPPSMDERDLCMACKEEADQPRETATADTAAVA